MSRDTRREQGDALPLPEMNSPPQLDEKILAHARARAPQRRVTSRPGWMSGLAAASVVGIAVMITLPGQDGVHDTLPAPHWEARERTPAALSQPEALQADTLTDDVAQDARVDAQNGTQKDAQKGAQKTEGASLSAAPPKAVAAQSSARQSAGGLREEQARPDAQALERKMQAGASAKKIGRASPQPALNAVAPEAEQSAYRTPESSIERDQEDRDGATHQRMIEKGLETCAALLRSDDRPAAISCYAALRKDCGDCTLPPTLDAALEAQASDSVTSP